MGGALEVIAEAERRGEQEAGSLCQILHPHGGVMAAHGAANFARESSGGNAQYGVEVATRVVSQFQDLWVRGRRNDNRGEPWLRMDDRLDAQKPTIR